MNMNGKGKVVVGMSGGVDSSVVAYLLKSQGYEVVGLHMKNASEESAIADEKLVREICEHLQIECQVVEYTDEMQKVKDYFAEEYSLGRTPNPCVLCNKLVKFKPFIDYTEKIDADYFATGHYAVVEHDGEETRLVVAKDSNKDQTYFLNQLSLSQLKKALFPLGSFNKDEVREIAKQIGLPNADKKDSQDICFLGSEKFKDFMEKNYPAKPGKIIDELSGKVVGEHKGLNKYTIGQRKGLGIGGGFGKTLDAWFVTKKDSKTNTLYVAQGGEDVLFSDSLICSNFNWIARPENKTEFNSTAKFRYRQNPQGVKVVCLEDGSVKIEFDEKQKAITPGQFVVLYQADGDKVYCLGGGQIDKVLKNGEVLHV